MFVIESVSIKHDTVSVFQLGNNRTTNLKHCSVRRVCKVELWSDMRDKDTWYLQYVRHSESDLQYTVT